MEECVSGMGQSSNYVAVKVVPISLKKEEFVEGMEQIKLCKFEGCTNQVIQIGLCMRHGAKKKQCSSEGCTNQVVKRGVRKMHGAKSNTNDQSTAFGSEYEMTTATQTLPNQRASGAAVREGQGQGGSM